VTVPTSGGETEDEIRARIGLRFDIISRMTELCRTASIQSMIVSGPPGLGKTHGIDAVLGSLGESGVDHEIVSGYARPTGLVKKLWRYRHPGMVLVLDDIDSIFDDSTSTAFLKKACDSTETRTISRLSEFQLFDEETGEEIPRQFDFEGSLIFVTNLNFDDLIDRGSRHAPHLEALISRSMYVDTTISSSTDKLVRILQVIEAGMLSDLTDDELLDVVTFVTEFSDAFRELSLRTVLKVAAVRRSDPDRWTEIAMVVTCR
jgi:hypothetical protein